MPQDFEDIRPKIAQARGQGISDDDIVKYLSTLPNYTDKIAQAKQTIPNLTSQQLVEYLGGAQEVPGAPAPNLNDQARTFFSGSKWSDIPLGIGSGLANTVTGARDFANTLLTPKGSPVSALPEAPEFLRKAAETPENASGLFKASKGAEQMAEFFIPEAAIGKGVKLAGNLPKFSKTAKVLTRAGSEAASSGLITGAQTHGNIKAADAAAAISGLTSGAFATVGELLRSVPVRRDIARKAYQNLKFPEKVSNADIDEIVTDALDNRIMNSRAGLEKSQRLQSERSNAVTSTLAATSAQKGNPSVDFNIIEAPARNLASVARSLGKDREAAEIDAYLARFAGAKGAKPAVPGTPGTPATQVPSVILGPNGSPLMTTVPATPGTPGIPATPPNLTVMDAQEAKQQLQLFAHNVFGKDGLSVSQKDIDALVSNGIKTAIEDIVPQVKQMNRDTQISIYLTNAIDDWLKHSEHGLTTFEKVAFLMNPKMGLPFLALRSPRVRSALAIAADKFGKASKGNVVGPLSGGTISIASPFPDMPGGPKEQK